MTEKRRGGERCDTEHYLLFIRVFVIYSIQPFSNRLLTIQAQFCRISFAIYSLFILLFIQSSDILYKISEKFYTKCHPEANT